MATIQGIYIALFGRPADPLGLAFFDDATGGGADLTAIGDLAATAEYQDRFDGMNNAQIVTAIYQSLFNRAPELAGLTFFVNALNNGELNINNVAIAILDGAQGTDLDVITNKEAAADAFTAAIAADPAALAAYNGAGAAAGRAYLSPITADPASVPDLDAAIADLVAGAIPGENFFFTTGVDELIGTDGNDTFRAVHDTVPGTTHVDGTLNPLDYADGGAGIDTLYIDVDLAGPWSHSATLKGFEIVKLDQEDAVLTTINSDLFDASLQELWQISDFGNLTLRQGVLAGYEGDANPLTSTIFAGGTTQNVALAGVDDNADITFDGAALVEATVSGSLAADGYTLVLGEGATTEIETLYLNLTTDTILDLSGLDDLLTIDASGSTGGLDIGTTTALGGPVETIIGGQAGDDITVVAATTYVEAGKGADVVDLGATGTETLIVINAGDTGLLPGAIDSYTNFITLEDSFDFGIDSGSFLDIGDNGAGSGYVDALTNANTTFAADAEDDLTYVFSHNGVDGWLFVDANLDGSADYAIELIGVIANGGIVGADIVGV